MPGEQIAAAVIEAAIPEVPELPGAGPISLAVSAACPQAAFACHQCLVWDVGP